MYVPDLSKRHGVPRKPLAAIYTEFVGRITLSGGIIGPVASSLKGGHMEIGGTSNGPNETFAIDVEWVGQVEGKLTIDTGGTKPIVVAPDQTDNIALAVCDPFDFSKGAKSTDFVGFYDLIDYVPPELRQVPVVGGIYPFLPGDSCVPAQFNP
jgi:hypothetical protein